MISLRLENGVLKSNGHTLFDLKKPYRISTDIEKAGWGQKRTESYMYRTPGEVYDLGGRHRYRFKTSHNHFHSLIPINKHGFRSNTIYTTSNICASIFIANSISHFLDNLDKPRENLPGAIDILRIVIGKIASSFPFNLVLVDFPNYENVLSGLGQADVLPVDYKVVKPIGHQDFRFINGVLNQHGEIPLSLLDGDDFSSLPIDATDIDLEIFDPEDKILILSGMHPTYAGYLAHTIRYHCGVDHILPLSIFRIWHHPPSVPQ